MMTNLFSTFDPSTGVMSMNWISSIMFVIMLPKKFWVMNSKPNIIMMKTLYSLKSEIMSTKNYKSTQMIMISMFMLIMMNNIMGILPYIFTASSHLVYAVSMALPMWMSFMLFGWTKKTNMMLAHLVPNGTPSMLMPFMVMIETTSSIIRPGSLAVRLSANMIAGHLLMSLLGNNSIKSNFMMMISMSVIIVLMMFESAVAIIQSYVFMTLSTLYSSEI